MTELFLEHSCVLSACIGRQPKDQSDALLRPQGSGVTSTLEPLSLTFILQNANERNSYGRQTHASALIQLTERKKMDQVLLLQERIELATRIGESHYREFKSAIEGPPNEKKKRSAKEICADISKTLVAFANADGGELYVGIEDDGTVTGLMHSSEELDTLRNAYKTHVHADTPLPRPQISLVEIKEKSVLYFSISKGDQYAYLTSDGKCLKRLDLESIPVGSEKIQAERLEHSSRTWDRTVESSATLDDLDFPLLQQISNQIAYGVTAEKCLQHLGLAEFTPSGLKLKSAALLLFAKDVRKFHPGCFVRIFTIDGKERRSGEAFNVIKDDIVADSVIKLVDSAWERLSYALTMHTSLTDNAKFKQSYMYPQIACREALINAIVHRNYAIQGRGIEVSIFTDRLEIASPGRILSTISLDDIRQLKSAHESRNPLIARVLREVGYVREMGEGIRRIYDVMRSNALAEPDIQSSNDNFTVTLFHRSMYDPRVKLWLSLFDEFNLPESQTAVLALGFEGKEFSTQDIIDRLGIVDTDQVREILTPLRKLGFVTRTKNDAKAMLMSKKMKIPKRSVPMFAVIANPATSAQRTHEGEPSYRDEERAISQKTEFENSDIAEVEQGIQLHVGNINYRTGPEELYAAIDAKCTVLSLDFPEDKRRAGFNKGFAFVTVAIDKLSPADILSKFTNIEVAGRKLSINLSREQERKMTAG
ncbi:ATP-binding protein [Variovorax sp. RKNM96]|uniref:ATP-binding protein n=1 Tax=Variovorax sp. RKNM96 TaxID=2681552 RepID=UPI00197EE804|nr:ATP-binding protein [Variovorax sp. RKNM96]